MGKRNNANGVVGLSDRNTGSGADHLLDDGDSIFLLHRISPIGGERTDSCRAVSASKRTMRAGNCIGIYRPIADLQCCPTLNTDFPPPNLTWPLAAFCSSSYCGWGVEIGQGPSHQARARAHRQFPRGIASSSVLSDPRSMQRWRTVEIGVGELQGKVVHERTHLP